MNAVSLKPNPGLNAHMEHLARQYGARRILLAALVNLLKRSRPPDIMADLRHVDQPDLAHLSDRMRADIGLPPGGPVLPSQSATTHADLVRYEQMRVAMSNPLRF